MATYILIGSDGKEYGPVSAEDVRQWFVAGRINAATKICVTGAGEWKSLLEFPEFNDLWPKNSTPPTPSPLPADGTPHPKLSALAVASLVLGVIGFFTCGIAALIGLILGIVAIVKIKNSEGRLTGFGFALAGIIVSGIFVLLIPIFAAIFGTLRWHP